MYQSRIEYQTKLHPPVNPVRKIELQPGQIFQGRVNKLFPNHLASLSINGLQLTARLEAALTAGKNYFFEVQKGKGIPQLRVLDANVNKGEGLAKKGAVDLLIQQLGLPTSKHTQTLIHLLSKQQIPFTKQAILAADELLGQLSKVDANDINLIVKMMQRQGPLTVQTHQSLRSYQNGSVLDELDQLSLLLRKENHPALKEIERIQSELQKPGNVQSPVVKLLGLYVDETNQTQLRNGARSLLGRLGVLENTTTIEGLAHHFKQSLFDPRTKHIVENLWPNMSKEMSVLTDLDSKKVLNQMVSILEIPIGKRGSFQMGQLLQLLNSNQQPEYVNFQSLAIGNLTSEEKVAMQRALEAPLTFGREASINLGEHIQSIIKLLGLQYEHEIRRYLESESPRESLKTDQLKALLLRLHDQELPSGIKEKIQQTLLKLTGQQILAQEQTGATQQMLLQLPLSLGSFQTDVTMQWEGKKTDKGELDPSFCRILFYLTLESLKETIVDVQIQNRIVTLTVFNEHEKPYELINLLTPSLKKALKSLDYQLLAINWKGYKDVNNIKESKKDYQAMVNYKGVDVRI